MSSTPHCSHMQRQFDNVSRISVDITPSQTRTTFNIFYVFNTTKTCVDNYRFQQGHYSNAQGNVFRPGFANVL